jgi:hypothetical protein
MSNRERRTFSLPTGLLDRLTPAERENLSATVAHALREHIAAREACSNPIKPAEIATLRKAVQESGVPLAPGLFRLLHIPGQPDLTDRMHALTPMQAYILIEAINAPA